MATAPSPLATTRKARKAVRLRSLQLQKVRTLALLWCVFEFHPQVTLALILVLAAALLGLAAPLAAQQTAADSVKAVILRTFDGMRAGAVGAVSGLAAAFPDNQRISILALLPFFVIGALLLSRVAVRYASWDLTHVHLVDERTGTVLGEYTSMPMTCSGRTNASISSALSTLM